MLSRVSLIVLLGLAALVSARYSSEEYGERREDRRPARPWYWRRFSGRGGRHGGGGDGGAPWMPPHGPHGGPHGHHRRGPPFPPPPFLNEATEEARKEFYQIFENANQTKAQTKERVHEWASRQPSKSVQEGLISFEKNLTLARAETQRNATAVINQLETALDRFTTILEDETLTQRETMEKLRNAARSFDRDVVFAVRMIMRNARMRIGQKFFPRPDREHGPFPGEGMPFPGPHGPMPPPPPPPPPMPFGPEGPIDPFLPPPPPPKGEESEDMGIFLPGDF